MLRKTTVVLTEAGGRPGMLDAVRVAKKTASDLPIIDALSIMKTYPH
jgi:hypothetical protein